MLDYSVTSTILSTPSSIFKGIIGEFEEEILDKKYLL